MANSGIPWIDVTFDWCVRFLYELASVLNISYEEINVWLFVVALPVVLTGSLTLNVWFLRRVFCSRTTL